MTELQSECVERTYLRIETARHCYMVAAAAGNTQAAKRHIQAMREQRRTLKLQREATGRIH